MSSKHQYEENGFVVLKSFFSEDEIGEYSCVINKVFQQWMSIHEKSYIENDLINMSCLTDPLYFKTSTNDRLKFFELIAHKKLVSTVNSILGKGVYFHDTQLFFNPYNKHKSPYWHRDFQYSGIEEEVLIQELGKLKCLHLRIPLVSEKGVELIPKTHLRWDTSLERNVRLELEGHKNSENLPGSELISLDRGDLLIFDAEMLHKGNYSLNKTRMAFDICVGLHHSILEPGLNYLAQPSLEEIEKIPIKEWYANTKQLFPDKKV